MASNPVGTMYVELSLDSTKYTRAQKEILAGAEKNSADINRVFKTVGTQSDEMYNAMRKNIENALNAIKQSTLTSASERVRAEETAAAKIKSLNDQQFGHQTGVIGKLKEHWVGATVAIGAAMMTVSKAMTYMEEGAKAMQQESSFKIMAEEAGVNAQKMINSMKAATRETIDDSQMMQKATKMMLAGYNPEQIERFSKVAITASQYMGVSVEESFDRIADALSSRLPKALVASGAATTTQMNIVKAAIKAGASETELFELAIANLTLKQLQLMGTQDGAALSLQRFKAQVNETKEAIGMGLIVVLQKGYAVFQAVGAEALRVASNVFVLSAGFKDLVSHLPGTDKASWQAGAAESTAAAKAAMMASGELLKKAEENWKGEADTGKRASKEAIDAQKNVVKSKLDGLKAYTDAAGNADANAKNALSEQISKIKETYETAVSEVNKYAERQRDAGANELNLIQEIYDRKSAAITEAYNAEREAIERSSLMASEKSRMIARLDKESTKLKIENTETQLKAQIAAEREHINVMANAYKTIGDYSEIAMQAQIKQIDEKYKKEHAHVKEGSQDEIDLERAKQTEIFNLRNSGQQKLISLQLSYLETIKGQQSIEYKEMAALEVQAQADSLERVMQGANQEFDKVAWLTARMNEEDAKRLESKASYLSDIDGMEKQTLAAQLEAIEKRKSADSIAYGEQAAAAKAAQEQIKALITSGQASWLTGLTSGLQEWAKEASNVAKNLEKSIGGWLDKATDSLVDFCMTGKADFASLTQSIIKDLLKIMVQAQMANIYKGLMGSGTGGGGLLSSIFGGMSTGTGASSGVLGSWSNWALEFHKGGTVGESYAPMRSVPAFAFAGAPRLHNGLAADEFPAVLQRGERVIPKGGANSLTVSVPVIGFTDKKLVADLQRGIESKVVSIFKDHS